MPESKQPPKGAYTAKTNCPACHSAIYTPVDEKNVPKNVQIITACGCKWLREVARSGQSEVK